MGELSQISSLRDTECVHCLHAGHGNEALGPTWLSGAKRSGNYVLVWGHGRYCKVVEHESNQY